MALILKLKSQILAFYFGGSGKFAKFAVHN